MKIITLSVILLLSLCSYTQSGNVTSYDVQGIKLGNSLQEVNKRFKFKRDSDGWSELSKKENGYHLVVNNKIGEKFVFDFTPDALGAKLYYVNYNTEYITDNQFADKLFTEIQSQIVSKYGEPTAKKRYIQEDREFLFCWGKCDCIAEDNNRHVSQFESGIVQTHDLPIPSLPEECKNQEQGQRMTAEASRHQLTVELIDYSLNKEVFDFIIKSNNKSLDDFLSYITKYHLGLNLDQAKIIFTDKHKSTPDYQEHNQLGKYSFKGIEQGEYADKNETIKVAVFFTGEESKSQLDNKIYHINYIYSKDSANGARLNMDEIVNRFSSIYGKPTDTINKEKETLICWGVCMKSEDRSGSSFASPGYLSLKANTAEGQTSILRLLKNQSSDYLEFEQFDYSLQYKYGKAVYDKKENETRSKVRL